MVFHCCNSCLSRAQLPFIYLSSLAVLCLTQTLSFLGQHWSHFCTAKQHECPCCRSTTLMGYTISEEEIKTIIHLQVLDVVTQVQQQWTLFATGQETCSQWSTDPGVRNTETCPQFQVMKEAWLHIAQISTFSSSLTSHRPPFSASSKRAFWHNFVFDLFGRWFACLLPHKQCNTTLQHRNGSQAGFDWQHYLWGLMYRMTLQAGPVHQICHLGSWIREN